MYLTDGKARNGQTELAIRHYRETVLIGLKDSRRVTPSRHRHRESALDLRRCRELKLFVFGSIHRTCREETAGVDLIQSRARASLRGQSVRYNNSRSFHYKMQWATNVFQPPGPLQLLNLLLHFPYHFNANR
jgi:hypothetical protein